MQIASDYFRTAAASLKDEAIHALDVQIARIRSEAAGLGALGDSRHWLSIQAACIESVERFGASLHQKLMSFDVEHTVIKRADFDLAVETISQFATLVENRYKQLTMGTNAFGGSRLPMDLQALQRAVTIVVNQIEAQRSVFRSQKSFIRWAWGDLRKRAYSGVLVIAGAAIWEIVKRLMQF